MNDKSTAARPFQAFRPIRAEDAEARSADPVAANIDRLKQLFPEAFTEDAGGSEIDFEVLKRLLGGQVTEREERYVSHPQGGGSTALRYSR